MILSSSGLAQPAAELGHHLARARAEAAAACARSMELWQRTGQVLAEAQAVRQVIADTRRQRRSSPPVRELQHLRSEHARLLARLATMPVIEQAKGIIMAQWHCGEAEAFDLLRRASQRSNMPVRDLAAQLAATAARTAPPGGEPEAGRSGR